MIEPRFEVCAVCGKHGRILDANGVYGFEVACKSEARGNLEIWVDSGQVPPGKKKVLAAQIEKSTLPEQLADVDSEVNADVEIWNFSRSQVADSNYCADRIHEMREMTDLVEAMFETGSQFVVMDLTGPTPRIYEPHFGPIKKPN